MRIASIHFSNYVQKDNKRPHPAILSARWRPWCHHEQILRSISQTLWEVIVCASQAEQKTSFFLSLCSSSKNMLMNYNLCFHKTTDLQYFHNKWSLWLNGLWWLWMKKEPGDPQTTRCLQRKPEVLRFTPRDVNWIVRRGAPPDLPPLTHFITN